MENLNDVEFGSDQNAEEAPILVAQRYLNIFRQIHIFKKDKRDQFDDELLALPQNILDYFKRLPGGRLLVEHIEDVKTERGISFVKSNKDDFTDGTDTPVASNANVPTQFVGGGNIVMDSSFAETFAQSMAEAFKQIPVASGGVATSLSMPSDFGRFFELIAEEIRTSRTSLLDVLKETRNVTDSVIASQVSISRILESILSSKNRDETDVADLNNRIIASQASITKLLEGLYTANVQKNEEISDYLNVDNKLQDFREYVTKTINSSLQSLTENLYNSINHQTSAAQFNDVQLDRKLALLKDEIKADILSSLGNNHNGNASVAKAYSSRGGASEDFNNLSNFDDDIKEDYSSDVSLEQSQPSLEEKKKKNKNKKKKKKNSNNDLGTVAAATGGALVADNAFSQPASLADIVDDTVEQAPTVVNGVIRNSDYKHEDDFSHINLDEPPLEIDEDILNQEDLVSDTLSQNNSVDEIENHPAEKIDTAIDDLDSILSEQSTLSVPDENEDNRQDEDLSLDSFMDDDGLDFALPEQSSNLDVDDDSKEEKQVNANEDINGFMSDDGLDFALPEQGISVDDEKTDTNNTSVENFEDLNSLLSEKEDESLASASSDNTNDALLESTDDLETFSVPDEAQTEAGDNSSSTEDGSLDTFLVDEASDDLISPVSSEEENIENEDEQVVSEQEDEDYQDVEDEIPAEEDDSPAATSNSRYAAELDRIRDALTSDSVDISSLDKPIALDDYSDDENVPVDEQEDVTQSKDASSQNDEDWEYEYVEDDGNGDTSSTASKDATNSDDWEWEYVDENGNPVQAPADGNSDDDWEWEYVEDDENATSDVDNENNPK